MVALRDLSTRLAHRLALRSRELATLLVPALTVSVVLGVFFWLTLRLAPPSWKAWLDATTTGTPAQVADRLKALLGDGPKGMVIFGALQILQVVVAPIPGQLVAFAGGWVFGFWKGLTITMAGVMIGSWLAMTLTRRFGRPMLERFVPPGVERRFDYLLNDRRGMGFFALFLFPAVPDDALCFVAGLSAVRLERMMLLCFFGRLPGFAVLSYAGAGAGTGGEATKIVFALAVAIGLIGWLFSEELTDWMTRVTGNTTHHD